MRCGGPAERSDRNGRSTKAARGGGTRPKNGDGRFGTMSPQRPHGNPDPRIGLLGERRHGQFVGQQTTGQMLAAAFAVAAADQQQLEIEVQVIAAGCREKRIVCRVLRMMRAGALSVRTERLRAEVPRHTGAGQRRPRRPCRRRKVDDKKDESDVSAQFHDRFAVPYLRAKRMPHAERFREAKIGIIFGITDSAREVFGRRPANGQPIGASGRGAFADEPLPRPSRQRSAAER